MSFQLFLQATQHSLDAMLLLLQYWNKIIEIKQMRNKLSIIDYHCFLSVKYKIDIDNFFDGLVRA